MQQTILFKCKGRPSRTPLRVISGFRIRQSAQTFSLSRIAARIYSRISAGISARITNFLPKNFAVSKTRRNFAVQTFKNVSRSRRARLMLDILSGLFLCPDITAIRGCHRFLMRSMETTILDVCNGDSRFLLTANIQDRMQNAILFKCKGRPSRTPLRVISGFRIRQSAQTFSLSRIAARIYSRISAGISARITAGITAGISARIAAGISAGISARIANFLPKNFAVSETRRNFAVQTDTNVSRSRRARLMLDILSGLFLCPDITAISGCHRNIVCALRRRLSCLFATVTAIFLLIANKHDRMQNAILFKCKGRPSRTPLRVISGFRIRQSAQTFSLSRIAARIADAATTPSAAVASVIIGAIAIWSALAIAPTMLQAQSAIAYIFILLMPWWIAAGARSIAMAGESSKGGDK